MEFGRDCQSSFLQHKSHSLQLQVTERTAIGCLSTAHFSATTNPAIEAYLNSNLLEIPMGVTEPFQLTCLLLVEEFKFEN